MNNTEIYKTTLATLLLIFLGHTLFSQKTGEKISKLEKKQQELKQQMDSVNSKLENLRLINIHEKITSAGLPHGAKREEITKHPGIIISYNEDHELANWVANMITPQIKTGNFSRTNDFRPDTTIATGTAVDKDYFLKHLQSDSSYEYDNYGYDRGHLAASADYRWSKTAMSATYYYSNMTPQRQEFNREGWAELENFLRNYVANNNTPIIVYTGPVLNKNLEKVERSINKISLPEYHYKIAYDKVNNRTISFIMPNRELEFSFENYTVSIDSIEKITGLDFLTKIEDSIEKKIENEKNPEVWFSGQKKNYKLPLTKEDMPEGAFNTINARAFMGTKKKITVCGTVVSSHKSAKDNTFLNLDKTFPNQVFTVTIWDNYQRNFPYEAHEVLMNKKICITGKVKNFSSKPAIFLKNENNIRIID